MNPLVKNIDGPVFGAGFADWGYHGYWASDFLRVDPHLGSLADYRRLSDALHRRGMTLVQDIVGERIDVSNSTLPSVLAQIQGGKMRAIATTGAPSFAAYSRSRSR